MGRGEVLNTGLRSLRDRVPEHGELEPPRPPGRAQPVCQLLGASFARAAALSVARPRLRSSAERQQHGFRRCLASSASFPWPCPPPPSSLLFPVRRPSFPPLRSSFLPSALFLSPFCLPAFPSVLFPSCSFTPLFCPSLLCLPPPPPRLPSCHPPFLILNLLPSSPWISGPSPPLSPRPQLPAPSSSVLR